jgi:hypothetical protein
MPNDDIEISAMELKTRLDKIEPVVTEIAQAAFKAKFEKLDDAVAEVKRLEKSAKESVAAVDGAKAQVDKMKDETGIASRKARNVVVSLGIALFAVLVAVVFLDVWLGKSTDIDSNRWQGTSTNSMMIIGVVSNVTNHSNLSTIQERMAYARVANNAIHLIALVAVFGIAAWASVRLLRDD